MMWTAKNKATGAVTGPHSDEYKIAMESNRATWRRHIWTPYTAPKPAEKPASLADVVKPAKTTKADLTSEVGE